MEKRYRKVEEVKKWKCRKCDRRWEERPEDPGRCPEGGIHKLEDYDGYTTKKMEESRTAE